MEEDKAEGKFYHPKTERQLLEEILIELKSKKNDDVIVLLKEILAELKSINRSIQYG